MAARDSWCARAGDVQQRPRPPSRMTCRLSPSRRRQKSGRSSLRLLDASAATARAKQSPDYRGDIERQNTAARMSDAEILREVRKIIAESETRQQRELALRVTQVVRDVDAARVGDLARVEQGLRQIQGLTDAELIRHRDTLNHLLRVTQR